LGREARAVGSNHLLAVMGFLGGSAWSYLPGIIDFVVLETGVQHWER